MFKTGNYVVELAAEPVATYDGGVSGLSATKPDEGKRLDTTDSSAQRYRNYLEGKRAKVLDKVPDAEVLYTYETVFNGFSAHLTGDEARVLAKTPGVKSVLPDEEFEADTVSTPTFLGLAGSGGVWEKQYGGSEHAGEGVIVGVIDSGFVPENPSFGALSEPRPDQAVIDAKWNGTCDTGASGDPSRDVACNNKVIGARWYKNGATTIPEEYDSPRDYHGHGSHTASTAAGDYGVDAIIAGNNVGKISGMAPAARLAIYKVCWRTAAGSCGANSGNSVAAIEDATNDGVDVLNFSISGSATVAFTATQTAYFNAAAAGVFIANSAGNSGPGSTVNHNTPWTTTVAASTHGRTYNATATLGNGVVLNGSGRGAALPSAGVVLSKDIPKAGSSVSDANLCAIGALDPAKAAGKIVACARGTVARTDKSKAVQTAGGVGMILYNVNPAANDTAPDFHAVPTVHITIAEAQKLTTYLGSTSTPTASFTAGVLGSLRAPEMAAFSSAGPAIAGGGDLLKPDITAPGVDVIAAVAPPGNNGENFASYQGTSMSSPHIAGIAALIIGKHPDWSPMAVKSALMTTASQTDNQGKPIQRDGHDATAFDYGSGHVTPAKAFDPGLVYESGPEDWLAWGCGIGELKPKYPELCAQYNMDPSQLNYPSIAIGHFVRTETITRTVTNVSDKTSTYFALTDAPKGTKMTVSPSSMSIRPGQSVSFKVTITRTDAALGSYTEGSYTWRDLKGHSVRSPVVVKPAPLSAPASVDATGTSGSVNLSGTVDYTGTLNAAVKGLTASQITPLVLSDPGASAFDTAHPQESNHTKKAEVTVPAGGLTRINTYASDYPDETDVDLFFYQKNADGSLAFLGSSAGDGADEGVELPGGATYVVYVDLFSSMGGMPVTVKLNSLVLVADEHNLTLSAPSQPVKPGQSYNLTGTWSGLTAGKRYTALVTYTDTTGTVIGSTTVTVIT